MSLAVVRIENSTLNVTCQPKSTVRNDISLRMVFLSRYSNDGDALCALLNSSAVLSNVSLTLNTVSEVFVIDLRNLAVLWCSFAVTSGTIATNVRGAALSTVNARSSTVVNIGGSKDPRSFAQSSVVLTALTMEAYVISGSEYGLYDEVQSCWAVGIFVQALSSSLLRFSNVSLTSQIINGTTNSVTHVNTIGKDSLTISLVIVLLLVNEIIADCDFVVVGCAVVGSFQLVFNDTVAVLAAADMSKATVLFVVRSFMTI